MVGDVDALQGLYLRGIGPPAAAIAVAVVVVAVEALILPAAGIILAVGLLIAGVGVPLVRRAPLAGDGRPAGARARRDDGRPRRGAGEARPSSCCTAARRSGSPRSGRPIESLVRHARRDATVAGLGTGLVVLIAGLTTVAVLAAAVSAHADGRLDRVLVAAVALLALASFEAVAPLPGAAQELGATLASGRRVLELIDRPVLIVDPRSPAPPPVRTCNRRARDGHRALRAGRAGRARRPGPANRARSPPRARRRERRRQDHRHPSPLPLPRPGVRTSHDRRSRREGDAPGGRATNVRARRPGSPRLQLDDSREPPPRATRWRRTRSCSMCCGGHAWTTGWHRCRSGSTRSSASRAPGSREDSASASCSPARCSSTHPSSCSTSRRRTSTPRPRRP